MDDDNEWKETDYSELAWLTSGAAVELDRFARGRSDDLSQVMKLAGILEKYKPQIVGTPSNFGIQGEFDFWPIWHVETEVYGKNLAQVPQFINELSTRISDLKGVGANRENAKELMNYVLELSKAYAAKGYSPLQSNHPWKHYLGA